MLIQLNTNMSDSANKARTPVPFFNFAFNFVSPSATSLAGRLKRLTSFWIGFAVNCNSLP
jgi:hypothetical protein